MFDKDLFNRICEGNCSLVELESFDNDIYEIEFDTNDPFEKYYNNERILSIIERYRDGKITDSYLAYWMSAYKFIVMGGFKFDAEDAPIYLKEFIIWQICDWLDSLSFFRRNRDYDLERCKVAFETLNKAYSECDSCNVIFAHLGFRNDDLIALIFNTRYKYFLKAYSSVKYVNDRIGIKPIDLDILRSYIKDLSEHGYKELIYGIFDDTEFD